MIQAFEVLGKDYESVKDSVIRTDFSKTDLEAFASIGAHPPISEAKFNDDLYFLDFKIERYKIQFLKDKIVDLSFVLDRNKTIEVLNVLIKSEDFKFKFFAKEQVENTEWMALNDNNEKDFVEFKTQRFEFDELSEFEIDNLEKYSFTTFRSESSNVVIREETESGKQFFVFEVSPQINKILKEEDFLVEYYKLESQNI